MKKLYYILLAGILLAGCSKNSKLDNDREDPVVTVTSPADNQSFTAGSTFNVTGTITDNNRIVQVHYHFSNLENGQLILDVHRYPGSSQYTIAENIQMPATGQYRLQIIARDNAGNEGRQTIVVNGN